MFPSTRPIRASQRPLWWCLQIQSNPHVHICFDHYDKPQSTHSQLTRSVNLTPELLNSKFCNCFIRGCLDAYIAEHLLVLTWPHLGTWKHPSRNHCSSCTQIIHLVRICHLLCTLHASNRNFGKSANEALHVQPTGTSTDLRRVARYSSREMFSISKSCSS